jgi:hypothetical protein
VLDEKRSGSAAPAPPTGGSQSSEQTTRASHDDTDELIELGARVAFELPAVVGTCRPEEVIAQAAARAGFSPTAGRRALSAYSGFLNAVLFPVVLGGHRSLPDLDEVPA